MDPNQTPPATPEPTTPPATPPATPPGTAEPTKPAKAKRWLLPLTGILVLIALAVGAWMIYASMNANAEAETPTAAITITDGGFVPATIKIQKGQDITWTNQSRSSVQIVSDQNTPGFKTNESLKQGETFSFTFDDSGTYNYHDPSNLTHKGTVIVE